jgi:hypothetical protein
LKTDSATEQHEATLGIISFIQFALPCLLAESPFIGLSNFESVAI